MFESRSHRHPVQTFQFWFIVLTCFGAVTAWKLDLISWNPPHHSPRILTDEPLPPPPADAGQFEPRDLAGTAPEPTPPPPDQPPETPAASGQRVFPIVGEGTGADANPPQRVIRTVSAEAVAPAPEMPPENREAKTDVPAASPASPPSRPEIDLAAVDRLINAGDDVNAHRQLSRWYWQLPERRPELMERLNLLASRIYFQPQPHYIDPYAVQFGERLETIAKMYSVPWEYLAKLNRVDPRKIQAGQKLKVIQGPFSAVVDLSDYELTVHAHGYYVTRFSVGIGKDGSTPTGTFRVTDKVIDPDYYGPDGVIAHDDPANPLGERWLAINNEQGTLQGYGIHGTIDPSSIGKSESQGCLRLRDREIEALYDFLTVGSEVIIKP